MYFGTTLKHTNTLVFTRPAANVSNTIVTLLEGIEHF